MKQLKAVERFMPLSEQVGVGAGELVSTLADSGVRLRFGTL